MAFSARPFVAGNWKMNGLKSSLGELEAVRDACKNKAAGRAELALCVPATPRKAQHMMVQVRCVRDLSSIPNSQTGVWQGRSLLSRGRHIDTASEDPASVVLPESLQSGRCVDDRGAYLIQSRGFGRKFCGRRRILPSRSYTAEWRISWHVSSSQ